MRNYLWSKFQQTRAISEGEKAQKFQNSRTTNYQIYMKLDPYLYHLNTFNIPNNEGVNEWVEGGATKKPPENAMKLRESQL